MLKCAGRFFLYNKQQSSISETNAARPSFDRTVPQHNKKSTVEDDGLGPNVFTTEQSLLGIREIEEMITFSDTMILRAFGFAALLCKESP